MGDLIKKLNYYLETNQLPGYISHKKMIPDFRPYKVDFDNYRQSAVNLILFYSQNRLKLILTKRSKNLVKHSGQISLPGGGKDNSDSTLWETAKRETFEEIGLQLSDNSYVGKLSSLVVPVSFYYVQPFVSFIDFEPKLNINSAEVDKVFFADYLDLFEDKNIKMTSTSFNGNSLNYRYFQLEKEQVWGLTAMILSEFNDVLKSIM